jgi:hypothetical protein
LLEPLASHSLLLASASHLALLLLDLLHPPFPFRSTPLSGTPQSRLWLHTTRPSTFLLRTLTNTPEDPIPYFGNSSQRHKINNYQTLKSRSPYTYKFPM